jgi:hypothetical protein
MITKKDIESANIKFEKLSEHAGKIPYVPALNESIAISTSMVNRANGIITEVAKWKGDLEPLIKHGYILEKIRSLVADYNALAHDHKIVFGKAPFVTSFETGMEELPKEFFKPELVKRANDAVFNNIRINYKDNKLKRVI